MDHGINTKLSYKNFQLKYFQISITGSLDPPLSPPLSISTHTPLPSSFTIYSSSLSPPLSIIC